jgi:hypothetical protein
MMTQGSVSIAIRNLRPHMGCHVFSASTLCRVMQDWHTSTPRRVVLVVLRETPRPRDCDRVKNHARHPGSCYLPPGVDEAMEWCVQSFRPHRQIDKQFEKS